MSGNGQAAMIGKGNERQVKCYHCRKDVVVPRTARTASCPVCYRGIVLDDLCVKDAGTVSKLATCGRVIVEKKGRAVTKRVEAAEGVEVLGQLEATISSGGPVYVGNKGRLKGEVHAPSLVVEPGAVIDGAFLRIGPDAFERTEPKPERPATA